MIPNLLVPDTAISVAGVTAYIQSALEEDDYLQQIWVTGEVSSANRYRSGLFFTLQDPDEKAAINCVVWASQLSRLSTLPEPGEQIIVLGYVRVYAQRGSYQLIIWQVLPAGEGLRALRYRQLRDRLSQEGLFDEDRKRSLPVHAQTVAVVTSPQAAAWGDIKRTLRRRYPGLRVLFSPALVQGEQAPASIVKAIQRVEADGRAEVMILARGGGATEDMACFNNEQVVRAIATCSIPVISGIGHQRDESLADLVSDVCAHTPTAAAEQAIPKLDLLITHHQERVTALHDVCLEQWDIAQTSLQRLRGQLRRLRIDQRVRQEQQNLTWQQQRMMQALQHQLQSAWQHHHLLQQTLVSLDPTAVLRRGYAILRQQDGSIVRSPQTVAPGDSLRVQLADGAIDVTVKDSSPVTDSSPKGDR